MKTHSNNVIGLFIVYRMIKTFTLGKGGEAAFLASPTEIQRIVFTKEKE